MISETTKIFWSRTNLSSLCNILLSTLSDVSLIRFLGFGFWECEPFKALCELQKLFCWILSDGLSLGFLTYVIGTQWKTGGESLCKSPEVSCCAEFCSLVRCPVYSKILTSSNVLLYLLNWVRLPDSFWVLASRIMS